MAPIIFIESKDRGQSGSLEAEPAGFYPGGGGKAQIKKDHEDNYKCKDKMHGLDIGICKYFNIKLNICALLVAYFCKNASCCATCPEFLQL